MGQPSNRASMSCASYVEPDRRRTRALQAPHRAVVRLPCWPTITLLYLSWGGPDRGLAPNATSRCSRYYHRRPPNSEDHAPRLGAEGGEPAARPAAAARGGALHQSPACCLCGRRALRAQVDGWQRPCSGSALGARDLPRRACH